MIPDNILEACLNKADFSVMKVVKDLDKKITFDEIKEKIRKEYDSSLFYCLKEKNYAQFLRPDDKSDLTTTKIELRKAECLRKCEREFSD